MKENGCLKQFGREWTEYLRKKGHRIRAPERSGALSSQNGQGKRYRWFLLCAEGPQRRLTPDEGKRLLAGADRSMALSEEAYVAVRFDGSPARVVVIPVRKALTAGAIEAGKGGIEWEG